ncbi:hypothetical protein THAOC_36694, partial [Thalassiosira oceanica]
MASLQRGMGDTCPFCRTPTPDSDAAVLALVQKRVEARDPDAIGYLGIAYYYEKNGLEQDIPRAIKLWTDAARLGDLNAHCMLGIVYCQGEGVEKHMARGVRHWQHAAMQGDPDSRHNLAVHEYKHGNHKLGVQHWMISAKMGYELSLNRIKDKFMKGHATKAQYAEALRGYQTALEETKSPQPEARQGAPRRPVARADRPPPVSVLTLDGADRQHVQDGECPLYSKAVLLRLPPTPPRAWNGAPPCTTPRQSACPYRRNESSPLRRERLSSVTNCRVAHRRFALSSAVDERSPRRGQEHPALTTLSGSLSIRRDVFDSGEDCYTASCDGEAETRAEQAQPRHRKYFKKK